MSTLLIVYFVVGILFASLVAGIQSTKEREVMASRAKKLINTLFVVSAWPVVIAWAVGVQLGESSEKMTEIEARHKESRERVNGRLKKAHHD